jgi:hypothetical protein
MRIGDERNRPRVAKYVQDINVHTNHYRYGTRYSIRWKSGIDPECSEVYGYQKFWPYILKGTVEHDQCSVILIHKVDRNVGVFRLEVSDGAKGTYSNSDRISCSMGSQ